MTTKPIFDGLILSGKPDLLSLYLMQKIPMIVRQNFTGWTKANELGLPTEAWYDAVAAGVDAPAGIVLVDHEAWPYATQAERKATAGKYLSLYAGLKSRRPDWRIGWYMDPIRRDFWRATTSRTGAQYLAWQAENNDLGAIMAPVTDIFMPSLYFFYLRSAYPLNCDAVGLYLEENISEAKRIRDTYGRPSAPIYPYVMPWKFNENVELDPDVWEVTRRTVMEKADGMVVWGGWTLTWSETAPWWVALKAQLTDRRRTM